MRLHNYFEFITKGGKKTFYNALLPGLNEKFLQGEAFSASIAVGTGTHSLPAGLITSLESPLCQKEARLYDYNFDISKGTLFVKKYIELLPDEYGGETLTEAGFTSSGGGLVNYVTMTGGIEKPQGEGLLIIGTLLLELSSDCRGELAKGENPIAKLLLGETSHSSADFHIGLGKNKVPMQKSVSGERLLISAALPSGCDFREVTVSASGLPCVRFDAAAFTGTAVNEQVELDFCGGGAIAEAEGLSSVNWVRQGGTPKPFSAQAIPSGAEGCKKNPFKATLKETGDMVFSPRGRYLAVFGKDILSVYEAGRELRPLEFSFYSFAYRDVLKAVPDDDGNLFVLTGKSPYVRVLQNIDGVLHPCSSSASFPSGITELGLSQYGGNTHIKCSVGNGPVMSHYTFLTGISNEYYSHQQTFFAQGYLRRFYSQVDEGEIILDLETGQISGNRQISDRAKQLLGGCREAKLCGKVIHIMAEGRWRLYGLDGEEIPLYDSGIRKLFISGSGNIVKLYANNALSGCWVCPDSKNACSYPIEVKPDGEVLGAAVSDRGIAVISSSKNVENYYIPLKRERLAVYGEGLEGEAAAEVTRHSFKNFSGRSITCRLGILEG